MIQYLIAARFGLLEIRPRRRSKSTEFRRSARSMLNDLLRHGRKAKNSFTRGPCEADYVHEFYTADKDARQFRLVGTVEGSHGY